MSIQVKEQKDSGWNFTQTVLDEKSSTQFIKQLTEKKSTGKENELDNHSTKVKRKAKLSMYPSPGNILHTGRQLHRTPGPGVLPLLPSQVFEPNVAGNISFENLYRTLTQNAFKDTDNRVPSGKQLDRTVVFSNDHEATSNCIGQKMTPMTCERSVNKTKTKAVQDIDRPREVTRRHSELCAKEQGCMKSEVKNHMNEGCTTEGVRGCRKSVHFNRRISELPVKGLNPLRVSGVLRNLPGYECRKEDLEFLKHMENMERTKLLKDELLSLRKERITSNQEKELAVARKEKIENDIQGMRHSYECTVQLGRAFLCKTQNPSSVSSLSDKDVLKRLNPVSIRHVLEDERNQLFNAQEELTRRKQEAPSPANHVQEDMSVRVESCNQRVKEAEHRVQQLQEEIIVLQQQVETTQKEVAEEHLQKKNAQIQSCIKHAYVSEGNHSLTEAERERMDRRLQRVVRRKYLYLERERLLQRIKENL
ncbi:Hypothetical predicted protein [Pelobates cultripes]|uniref:Uncharacterized protein n=2 Tax=Pelobates cultripes TaxID=61616 RepID=A0AAD1VKH5_PELCU|nr:Hypothetical predicted protein [Pelobates cultripes]